MPGILTRHPWIQYWDSKGEHLCQPDAVWETEWGIVVIEVKLKQTITGFRELRGLYMPVMEALLHQPVAGLQVCWALRRGARFRGPDVEPRLPAGDVATWFLRV